MAAAGQGAHKRRLAVAIVGPSILAAIGLATYLLLSPKNTDADAFLAKINVKDYRRIAIVDRNQNDAGSQASGIYTGTSAAMDYGELISAPGLVVTTFAAGAPGATPLPSDLTTLVARGVGPNNCNVLVYILRQGKTPPASWNVSQSQLNAIRAGTLNAIDIAAVCGRG